MYKKVVLSIVASVLALGLASFDASAQALNCVDQENCPSYPGDYDHSIDTETVTTSDDVVVEEIDVEEEETEEEPPMWPVYLSLGAIGATFLLVIIINLSGRKYNKK